MNKVRCKKSLGTWYYKKLLPDAYGELDGTVYELYTSECVYVASFGLYRDMVYYIETGIIL